MRTQYRFGSLLALLLAGCLSAGPVLAQDKPPAKKSGVPVPTHVIQPGEQCVEPTEEMRRNHMEKILHQRDRTVHDGIRTKQHSLKNCINCHADPKTNSVLGQDGFCDSCHRYAAVKIDCFSCHSAEREASAAGPAAPASAARALKTATPRDKKP